MTTASLFVVLFVAAVIGVCQRAPASSPRAAAFAGPVLSAGPWRALRAASGVQLRAQPGAGWPKEPPIRVGHGFDIHRLTSRDSGEAGREVIIGGVPFPDFDRRVVAHSDGDVVYHSLVDAIFGALGLPDIGQYFPDTDPRWDGAPSHVFMAEAFKQMDSRGYRIGNVDVTIIAQAPRMIVVDPTGEEKGRHDHKQAMTMNIASLLNCPLGRVNVKARTHENVDAVGEKRAVSCHVVVAMERTPGS